LHRKELLLTRGHSHFEKFASLTADAERYGLLSDPKAIGLEKGWRKALKAAHVKIKGHTLVSAVTYETTQERRAEIHRHKTAMRRQHLSLPMQAIQKYGYLNGNYTIFDYGCGRGDDLRALKSLEIDADGWDPHFQPSAPKLQADIVNLGFVINVIESREERDDTLRSAFNLARKFAVISALIGNPEYSGDTQVHCDGVLTTIGTFQKYYLPDELENYVRGTLGVPVMSIAQGIILAFRTEDEADRFRARRAGSRGTAVRGSMQHAEKLFLLDAEARNILSAFWLKAMELGREPLNSELDEANSLDALGLSPKTAFKFLCEKLGTGDIEAAARQRTDEMQVQFALGQFDGRVYYKYLSEDVQKDIDIFFGGYSKLQDSAKELLFSIADTSALRKACESAASEGLGFLLTDDSLQIHASMIDRIAPILRVYVGCALRLIGGLGRADLIKIHIESGKVSFMGYDDFDNQPVPYLVERIKVNLWTRRTEFFDYIAGYAPPPLLMKSLFLPEDHDGYDDQTKFDNKLMKAGIYDITNPHPSRKEFEASLEAKKLRIRGFDLISE
jgi:DNA phosphorothioation-associated putative methyltransferase